MPLVTGVFHKSWQNFEGFERATARQQESFRRNHLRFDCWSKFAIHEPNANKQHKFDIWRKRPTLSEMHDFYPRKRLASSCSFQENSLEINNGKTNTPAFSGCNTSRQSRLSVNKTKTKNGNYVSKQTPIKKEEDPSQTKRGLPEVGKTNNVSLWSSVSPS